MSANLFGGRYVGRMPAWHNQGTVDEQLPQMTATAAVEKYRLDVKYEKCPMWIPYQGGTIESPQRAVVREATDDDPQARVLGYVDEKFGLLQNMQIATILDPLTKEMPVETAGLLGKGETFWLMLDAGMAKVAGEDVGQFFSVVDFKAGQGRLRAVYTPVRMVCANTVEIGLAAATVDIAFNHHQDVANDLEWTVRLMAELNKAGELSLDALERMAAKRCSVEQAKQIIEAAFPLPKKSGRVKLAEELKLRGITDADAPSTLERLGGSTGAYDRRIARNGKYQEEALAMFERINDEHAAIAGSMYAAYNAVCEHIDHRQRAGRAEDVLVGTGRQAKLRSFKVAAKMTGIALAGSQN